MGAVLVFDGEYELNAFGIGAGDIEDHHIFLYAEVFYGGGLGVGCGNDEEKCEYSGKGLHINGFLMTIGYDEATWFVVARIVGSNKWR